MYNIIYANQIDAMKHDNARLSQRINRLERLIVVLQNDLDTMRTTLEQHGIEVVLNTPPPRKPYVPAPTRNIAPMRPIEELTDEAAALDESLSMEQIGRYLNQPRIRPEDVTLSPDDIARANQKRRRTLVDSELRRQMHEPLQLRQILLLLLITVIIVVLFFSMIG